jgi:phosphate transport system substrate-binding protein
MTEERNMKLKHLLAVLAVLAVVPVVMFAGQDDSGENGLTGSIKVAGSSTVYPVTTAVAEEFNKLHPAVEIPVQSTGTGGGFKNFFIPGKTDINDASRAIKDSERESAMENGIDAIEFQVGIDAITIVMNPEATWVDDITVEQLAKIWRPDNPAMTWSDVDPSWPNEKIELYGPTSASGTFDFFTEAVVGEEKASRSDYQGTEQDNTIVQAVAGSKYAMGYFGMAYYLENKDKIKALRVNGVGPSIETAKTGKYTPLSRPLFIYVSSKSLARPEVKEFLRFYIQLTSTELVREIGYVPMTEPDMKANMDKLEAAIEKYGN